MTDVLIVSVIANVLLAYGFFDTQRMCKNLIDDCFWMMGEITRLEKEVEGK